MGRRHHVRADLVSEFSTITIADSIVKLPADEGRRRAMGDAARVRAASAFSQDSAVAAISAQFRAMTLGRQLRQQNHRQPRDCMRTSGDMPPRDLAYQLVRLRPDPSGEPPHPSKITQRSDGLLTSGSSRS